MSGDFYRQHGKRWFDASASLVGLLLLSPLLLVAAIAIRLDTPGPSLFLQERTGRYGKIFRIIKFRTMREAKSSNARLITASGDPRITDVGRLLRKAKIDELPQLFNVLLGEMSLVGPRPEVSKYTRLYSDSQRQVFLAAPGITSPAALACVNEEEILAAQENPEDFYVRVLMPAKLEMDLGYCRNIRFAEDVRLVCATLGQLVNRRKSEVKDNKLAAHAEELI